MALVRLPFDFTSYKYIDYLSYISSWEIYPISGRLQEIPNFLTVTNPFDKYVWMWLLISVPALMTSFIMIEKLYRTQMKSSTRHLVNRSKTDFFFEDRT